MPTRKQTRKQLYINKTFLNTPGHYTNLTLNSNSS